MKINEFGVAFFATFYLISGVLMFIEAALSRFAALHLGVLGALSVALAFTMIKRRRVAVTFISLMILPIVVFGSLTLYASLMTYLIGRYTLTLFVGVLAVIYLALATLSFIYVIRKRRTFVE